MSNTEPVHESKTVGRGLPFIVFLEFAACSFFRYDASVSEWVHEIVVRIQELAIIVFSKISVELVEPDC